MSGNMKKSSSNLSDEEMKTDDRLDNEISSENEASFEIAEEGDEWLTDTKTITHQPHDFEALTPEQLINKQQKEVIDTADVLGIPVAVSGVLLRSYGWNKEKLFTDFFEDKDKVCKKAKTNLNTNSFFWGNKNQKYECGCCFEEFKGTEMCALSCMHFLCRKCWKSYLTISINDGPSCLVTKCPYPKCKLVVDENTVNELVDKEVRMKYAKYLSRSFVDDNPRIKWCPAPDCGKAVYCQDMNADEVQCSCGYKFCFKCNRESHSPASCEQLDAWLIKEKDESETANWITAHTKICPNCKRSIEKNGGCNHMTCSLCKYEFCWVCNDQWKTHGSETGGYYKCNKYKADEIDKKVNSLEKDKARLAIEKYMHYYKRYANNAQARRYEKDLREKADIKMRDLQLKNKYSSWIDVEYIQKGVEQLIECRNSLKYTYIYGYYLEEGPEKNLFEYLQEDLEKSTEILGGLIEANVDKFDRDQIIAQTKVAQTRLRHLLKDVKEGLTKQVNTTDRKSVV